MRGVIRVTKHAEKRFRERVGRKAGDPHELLVDATPRGDFRGWGGRRYKRRWMDGIVVLTAWEPDGKGWEYQIKVGFPVVKEGDDYLALTCLTKLGDGRRRATGSRVTQMERK